MAIPCSLNEPGKGRVVDMDDILSSVFAVGGYLVVAGSIRRIARREKINLRDYKLYEPQCGVRRL